MRNCRREKKQHRKEKYFEEGVCKEANIYKRRNHIKADVLITTYPGRGEVRKHRRTRHLETCICLWMYRNLAGCPLIH